MLSKKEKAAEELYRYISEQTAAQRHLEFLIKQNPNGDYSGLQANIADYAAKIHEWHQKNSLFR